MADIVLAGINPFLSLLVIIVSSSLLLPAMAITYNSVKLRLKSPHGLPFEHRPMSFPPSALEFFHPRAAAGGGAVAFQPAAAPTSLLYGPDDAAASKARADAVAVVASTIDADSSKRRSGGGGGAAGGVAAVVIAAVFMVLLALFASYVAIRRRGNLKKANINADAKEPDA